MPKARNSAITDLGFLILAVPRLQRVLGTLGTQHPILAQGRSLATLLSLDEPPTRVARHDIPLAVAQYLSTKR
ncbi:hypothetical protein N7475_009632 [Penicillium sp. IBT 31633x]|nr:hypothetical protein N7475_009632 [Penicillium sp. IBT 31633x]